MHHVYILYSHSRDRYYVGYSQDPWKRLLRHNEGINRSTKSGRPWILLWTRPFECKADALRYERAVKNRKSRTYLQRLAESGQTSPANPDISA